MTKILSALRITVVAVAFGLVVFATYVLVAKLVLAHDPKYLEGFIGAFMGALFAFLFIRLAEVLNGIYARKVQHYNGLVRLEYNLNEMMNICGEDIGLVDEGIRRCQDCAVPPGMPILVPLSFGRFAVDKDVLLSLANIDLVNEVFGLNVELRRTNDSMTALEQAIAIVADWAISGRTAEEPHRSAPGALQRELRQFHVFLESTLQRITSVLALVRLLEQDKPWLLRISRVLTRSRFSGKQLAMKDQEIERIRQEVEVVRLSHDQRLADIRDRTERG